ncbi:GNAT family N-acetyltransferase [Pseudooceanicola sp. LIPI14-2-Ac024]|uniref:GNAT family N-acetyltransferase n=1 Tax=Pseudooceanicola sp. LIPI14-2-Ac024 TaxID=3344875 RepID=UPI0035CED421
MTAFPCPIPVVETERVILRAPRDADLPAYAAYFATPRAEFTGGQRDEVDTYRMLMNMAGHWHMRGYGLWVIEDRATGATAGWTGILHHLDWPEPELGWTVFDGFEGKGLAHDAAKAARAFAAADLGLPAPISLIDPRNARSEALATRLGATVERPFELHDTAVNIWRHPDVREVAA